MYIFIIMTKKLLSFFFLHTENEYLFLYDKNIYLQLEVDPNLGNSYHL